MARSEWQESRQSGPGPFVIDVRMTPMANVAEAANVVAATAEEVSSSEVEVQIYRYDPDDSKPYNADAYSVWENLPARPDFPAIVAAASTDFNDNMKAFLEANVFLVSKERGSSHWLNEEELPSIVRALLRGELPSDA